MKFLRIIVIALLGTAVLKAEPPMRNFFALNVRQAEAAADWYARTFGFKEMKRFDNQGFWCESSATARRWLS